MFLTDPSFLCDELTGKARTLVCFFTKLRSLGEPNKAFKNVFVSKQKPKSTFLSK